MNDGDRLKRFWVGKNPRVKKAVEEYLGAAIKIEDGLSIPKIPMKDFALKHGVSFEAVANNIRTLKKLGLTDIEPSWIAKRRTEEGRPKCILCHVPIIDMEKAYRIKKNFESPYSNYGSHQDLLVGYICVDCGTKLSLRHEVNRYRVSPKYVKTHGEPAEYLR